jgi:hypothetical protein
VGKRPELGRDEVGRIFSRILHILGFPFRDEPFMKEALESRAMSRESGCCGASVGVGDEGPGSGRESTRC